ncbi:FecR domain-containing protein [Terricaulis sp.]|uniref:FecR family protein n=1 Tax=Terricaulis sp. TaxID=2768686 RepID=UPI00378482ED
MRHVLFAFGAICASVILFPSSASAQSGDTRIGAAAAVRNQVTGARAPGQERPLATGNPVFQNQMISTGANSVAQLLFTDQMTLSIGQRSQVTLDRYVYDPTRTSGGGATVSMARGAMRFVSGTQDPRTYQVRTPIATIGVRGTIVDLLLLDGRMFGILDEGRVIFTLNSGQTVELDRPGQAVEFFSDGSVSRPFTWRGRYETSFSTATFPLFGNPFADFPGFEGAYDADDMTNRTDDIGAPYGDVGQ